MKTNGLSCSHSRSTAKAFKAAICSWTSRCSQLSSTPVSSSSCAAGLGHHGPQLDTRGRGWAVTCLTTLYGIAILGHTGLRYRDTVFSHDTSPTLVCLFKTWLKLTTFNLINCAYMCIMCICILFLFKSFCFKHYTSQTVLLWPHCLNCYLSNQLLTLDWLMDQSIHQAINI